MRGINVRGLSGSRRQRVRACMAGLLALGRSTDRGQDRLRGGLGIGGVFGGFEAHAARQQPAERETRPGQGEPGKDRAKDQEEELGDGQQWGIHTTSR